MTTSDTHTRTVCLKCDGSTKKHFNVFNFFSPNTENLNLGWLCFGRHLLYPYTIFPVSYTDLAFLMPEIAGDSFFAFIVLFLIFGYKRSIINKVFFEIFQCSFAFRSCSFFIFVLILSRQQKGENN